MFAMCSMLSNACCLSFFVVCCLLVDGDGFCMRVVIGCWLLCGVC